MFGTVTGAFSFSYGTVFLVGYEANAHFLFFQECMCLIRGLCVEEGAATELTKKLTEHLKEALSDNKVRETTT